LTVGLLGRPFDRVEGSSEKALRNPRVYANELAGRGNSEAIANCSLLAVDL
jgi:hypothetical protein